MIVLAEICQSGAKVAKHMVRTSRACQGQVMRLFFYVVILWASATQLVAESLMDAAEFDSYTRGKTFYYGSQGSPYGAEEYLDNRRVRWSFLDGKCQEGTWYEERDLICFVYANQPDPQCWSFEVSGGGGLIARFENDPDLTELYEVEQSVEPLLCLGPEIGV